MTSLVESLRNSHTRALRLLQHFEFVRFALDQVENEQPPSSGEIDGWLRRLIHLICDINLHDTVREQTTYTQIINYIENFCKNVFIPMTIFRSFASHFHRKTTQWTDAYTDFFHEITGEQKSTDPKVHAYMIRTYRILVTTYSLGSTTHVFFHRDKDRSFIDFTTPTKTLRSIELTSDIINTLWYETDRIDEKQATPTAYDALLSRVSCLEMKIMLWHDLIFDPSDMCATSDVYLRYVGTFLRRIYDSVLSYAESYVASKELNQDKAFAHVSSEITPDEEATFRRYLISPRITLHTIARDFIQIVYLAYDLSCVFEWNFVDNQTLFDFSSPDCDTDMSYLVKPAIVMKSIRTIISKGEVITHSIST